MTSRLFYRSIHVGGNVYKPVMVTAQRAGMDVNGNPRYKLQVWIMHQTDDGKLTGYVWTPQAKGYRKTKDDCYYMVAYGLDDDDIDAFINTIQEGIAQ